MLDRSPNPTRENAPWSFERDVEDVLAMTDSLWAGLRGAHILVTGATGFIGCWLLETFRHANLTRNAGIRVTALTRNIEVFRKKAPHLVEHDLFHFLCGDVASYGMPAAGISHVIHAAADASAELNETNPRGMFDTVVEGTRRTLDIASANNAGRLLFLSSGAVYGQQPPHLDLIPEDWTGSPDCLNARNAYAEGKRAAEMLCAIHVRQHGLAIVVARIFALLGPYLPLNTHFAAGNFILDAIQGKQVTVQGNGMACRSYLYMTDLTAWLLHLLARGEAGTAYNVGSDDPVTIAALAERVANVVGRGEFVIKGTQDNGWNPGRYVPSTTRITSKLGLIRSVELDEAIRRTAWWNGWHQNERK